MNRTIGLNLGDCAPETEARVVLLILSTFCARSRRTSNCRGEDGTRPRADGIEIGPTGCGKCMKIMAIVDRHDSPPAVTTRAAWTMKSRSCS